MGSRGWMICFGRIAHLPHAGGGRQTLSLRRLRPENGTVFGSARWADIPIASRVIVASFRCIVPPKRLG